MLNNIKISIRMAVSIILMLVIVIAVMLIAIIGQFSQVQSGAEIRRLNDLHRTVQASLNKSSESALSVIDAIVSAPGVAKAFADKDRETLQSLTLPVFETLQRKYNVQQFQFHLPPATSFLRLHKLEKYGDDLSGFRFTVLNANRQQQPQYGMEKGVAGIGLRGVIPVYYQQKHVGSAEVGLSFGQDFFNRFTKRHNSPTALYVTDTASGTGFSTFASTITGNATTIDKNRFKAALSERQSFYSEISVNGKPYASLIAPIVDFSGKPLAVVEILVDRTEYISIYNSTLVRILLIGIVSVLIGLILALLLSRSITKPIEHLTESAAEVSRGNFDIEIEGTKRKDEIGSLARAVSRMSESIKLAMERLSQ